NLPDLTTEMLVDMLIHGVTPEFAQSILAAGITAVTAETLVDMRIHDVTAAFAEKVVQAQGAVSAEELVDMWINS
ncbi:MAG: hypothetical protein KC415_06830, partial [Anaerolineales bacterium]|nr:hypothetical protein [Anaerolineales bacterium]